MEQEVVQNQANSSVAWYKLADLIARREREKALNVFRLLSHSLQNKAYVLQLEGDILWAMDDAGAVDRYKQAAFIYHKDKKIIDAIALYEHVYQMAPSQRADLIVIIPLLYALIDYTEHFDKKINIAVALFEKNVLDESRFCSLLNSLVELAMTSADDKKWLKEKIAAIKTRLPEKILTKANLLSKL